jgi:hypothetical protein
MSDANQPGKSNEEISSSLQTRLYCKDCATMRKVTPCFKCGKDCIIPHESWKEPALPDVEIIRKAAKEIGYAIAVHGSLERDLDVVAVPWTEEALKYNYREVMEYIAKAIDGKVKDAEYKPLGRRAATIVVNGWYKNVDLSVAPMKVDGKASTPGVIERLFECFQQQVCSWFMACFSQEELHNGNERGLRFAEEAIELCQSGEVPEEKMHQLVTHVYARPKGEFKQEVGGVLTTLAVWSTNKGVDMITCGFDELARIWTKIPLIREKQKNKIH